MVCKKLKISLQSWLNCYIYFLHLHSPVVDLLLNRKAKELETTIKEKTYDFAGEAVTVREQIKSKRKSLASTLGLDKSRYFAMFNFDI